jgi:hypothetical protein
MTKVPSAECQVPSRVTGTGEATGQGTGQPHET